MDDPAVRQFVGRRGRAFSWATADGVPDVEATQDVARVDHRRGCHLNLAQSSAPRRWAATGDRRGLLTQEMSTLLQLMGARPSRSGTDWRLLRGIVLTFGNTPWVGLRKGNGSGSLHQL